jgi:HEAT repeat protein
VITESFLLMSILALIVLGLLATGMVVLHSSVVDARARRLAPAVEEARRILAASLSAGSVPSDHDLSRLLSLPRDRLTSLIGELSRLFRGERGEVIRRLARELDIVNRGFRLVASRLWWRRLEGARLLTLFDEARTVRRALLEDTHPLVRAQAAEWAWTKAKPDEIRTLVALLDDPDGLVRYSARDALIRLGPAAAPAVAEDLSRATGAEAVALLEVAGAINDPRLLPGALRLVSDGHPRTRELAARLLGSLGGAEAIDEMADLLDDPDAGVRSAAARGLGLLGYWPVGSRLAARLEDRAWDVRRSAGLALRSIGAPGVLLLRRATGSADPFAADMATQVLDLGGIHEQITT